METSLREAQPAPGWQKFAARKAITYFARRAQPLGRVSTRFVSIVGLGLGLGLVAAAVSGCGGSGGEKPAVAIKGTIVFASPHKGQYADIYLLDTQGTRRLTGDGGVTWAFPVWSPDGTQIAYITDKHQLAVVKRDGSGGAFLTPETNDSSLWPTRPAWLPDGNISFFVNGKIAVVRPDGTGVRVLTLGLPNMTEGSYPSWASGAYSWSPDGNQIVFDCSINVNEPKICVFHLFSGKSQTLLTPPRPVYALAWSPDGKKIVAGNWGLAQEASLEDLYVFDANGRGLRALAQPGEEENPAWSPDGEMIVYTSYFHSSFALSVMNADGSGAQQLLRAIGAFQPDWTAH